MRPSAHFWVPALALSGGLGLAWPSDAARLTGLEAVATAAPPSPPPAPPPRSSPPPPAPASPVVETTVAATMVAAHATTAAAPAPTVPPELVDDGADDVVELLPEPEPVPVRVPDPTPGPNPAPTPVVPELASIAKETWIYAEPRWGSRRIGYLRAGAVVERRAKPSGFRSCDEGWYRVEPKGYVCAGGTTATLDLFHPVVEASTRRPARDGLPYTYVMSRYPTAPLYARLPTDEEQLQVEPDLGSHLRRAGQKSLEPDFVEPPAPEPTPATLLYGRPAPGLASAARSADTLLLGRARTRAGFALLSTFDHEGRQFGLTTELAVVPLDRTRVVRQSAFAGLALGDGVTLPVAFVKTKRATRHVTSGAGLTRGEPLAWREAVPLGERSRRVGGVLYLEARDGTWVRDDQVVRADRFREAPAWATEGRRWIDVSILRQTLTAYVGTKPVYTTLVSTGADGLGDPKETHSTIQGTFLIHTKHLTVTMDSDDEGDEFDLRDVPFVQYFTEGFALHGAYWHDDFGTPRSHGCINLAPRDAAWLFDWTDPQVPEAWHAALTLKRGTLVHTHP